MIYIFHFSIVLILYIFFGRNEQTKNIFTATTFVYACFTFGQRWMTGTDFPNYLQYYIDGFTRNEWGYFGLQNLLRDNNFYFGILIFTVFLITQFNFYRFFLKLENSSMLIFTFLVSEIYFAQMSQIRQYVAISFFINAFYYAYKKETTKSFFNLLLAYSFHTSALFFMPLLFIRLPINRKRLLLALSTYSLLPLIDIHFLFSLPYFERYSHYVGGPFDMPLSFNHIVKYYAILVFLVFCTYYIDKFKICRYNQMVYNGVIFYMLIYGLSFHFAPLFRIATFLQVFEIVFLVIYSKKLKNLPEYFTEKMVAFLFIGIFSLSALVDSYTVGDYQFRPLKLYENRTENELITEINNFEQ